VGCRRRRYSKDQKANNGRTIKKPPKMENGAKRKL
jgi:hypothetical protein